MKVGYFDADSVAGTILIESCVFKDFSTTSNAGVFFFSKGNAILLNNVFLNNSANYGGVIYHQASQSK